LFEKRKMLRKEKDKTRSKLLMDQQILEEFKRRSEENNAYYLEQVDEINENIEKKEEFIKSYEKKFNEVEIYVQRQSRKGINPNYDYLIGFEIIPYISVNNTFSLIIRQLNENLKNVRNDLNSLLKENVNLKKRDENIEVTEENNCCEKQKKIKSIIKQYHMRISFLEKNNDLLKSKFNNLKTKVDCKKFLNTDLNIKIKDEANNKSEKKPKISQKELKIQEEDEFKEIGNDDEEKLGNDKIDLNYKKEDNDRRDDNSIIIKDINETYNYNVNKTNMSVNREIWGDISYIKKSSD